MDHNMPFGIASAHYNLGAVVDASIDIIGARQKEMAWAASQALRAADTNFTSRNLRWADGEAQATSGSASEHVAWEKLGVGPILKWADNLVPFRFPDQSSNLTSGSFHYAYDLDTIRSLSAPLGIPWHSSKFSDFAFTVTYLGFVWNLPERSVTLHEQKRLKYLSKLASFATHLENNRRIDKKLAQSINGTLSHICFVYPHGRAYLTGLSAFVAGFENKHKPRWAQPSLRSDIKWWLNILTSPSIPHSLISKGNTRDLDIWGDASTSWGIGICIGDEWDAWALRPGWKTEAPVHGPSL
jgi:hypothetical protein